MFNKYRFCLRWGNNVEEMQKGNNVCPSIMSERKRYPDSGYLAFSRSTFIPTLIPWTELDMILVTLVIQGHYILGLVPGVL